MQTIADGSNLSVPCISKFGNTKRDFNKLFIGDLKHNPGPDAYNEDLSKKNIKPHTRFFAKIHKQHFDEKRRS
jgi:hypothetical protein